MTFPVNPLGQSEKDILSFMAKHTDARIMRFESSMNETLRADGKGEPESLSINTPSFHRLLIPRLIENYTGNLFCIAHDGLECVQELER